MGAAWQMSPVQLVEFGCPNKLSSRYTGSLTAQCGHTALHASSSAPLTLRSISSGSAISASTCFDVRPLMASSWPQQHESPEPQHHEA